MQKIPTVTIVLLPTFRKGFAMCYRFRKGCCKLLSISSSEVCHVSDGESVVSRFVTTISAGTEVHEELTRRFLSAQEVS